MKFKLQELPGLSGRVVEEIKPIETKRAISYAMTVKSLPTIKATRGHKCNVNFDLDKWTKAHNRRVAIKKSLEDKRQQLITKKITIDDLEWCRYLRTLALCELVTYETQAVKTMLPKYGVPYSFVNEVRRQFDKETAKAIFKGVKWKKQKIK